MSEWLVGYDDHGQVLSFAPSQEMRFYNRRSQNVYTGHFDDGHVTVICGCPECMAHAEKVVALMRKAEEAQE